PPPNPLPPAGKSVARRHARRLPEGPPALRRRAGRATDALRAPWRLSRLARELPSSRCGRGAPHRHSADGRRDRRRDTMKRSAMTRITRASVGHLLGFLAGALLVQPLWAS